MSDYALPFEGVGERMVIEGGGLRWLRVVAFEGRFRVVMALHG